METEGRRSRRPRADGLCLEAEFNLGKMEKDSKGYIWSTQRCMKCVL